MQGMNCDRKKREHKINSSSSGIRLLDRLPSVCDSLFQNLPPPLTQIDTPADHYNEVGFGSRYSLSAICTWDIKMSIVLIRNYMCISYTFVLFWRGVKWLDSYLTSENEPSKTHYAVKLKNRIFGSMRFLYSRTLTPIHILQKSKAAGITQTRGETGSSIGISEMQCR